MQLHSCRNIWHLKVLIGGHSDTQVQFDPSTDSTWEDVDFDHYMALRERSEENTDQIDEEYGEDQTAESLHMDVEVQDSTLLSGNFGSVEEDFDLLNSEEISC